MGRPGGAAARAARGHRRHRGAHRRHRRRATGRTPPAGARPRLRGLPRRHRGHPGHRRPRHRPRRRLAAGHGGSRAVHRGPPLPGPLQPLRRLRGRARPAGGTGQAAGHLLRHRRPGARGAAGRPRTADRRARATGRRRLRRRQGGGARRPAAHHGGLRPPGHGQGGGRRGARRLPAGTGRPPRTPAPVPLPPGGPRLLRLPRLACGSLARHDAALSRQRVPPGARCSCGALSEGGTPQGHPPAQGEPHRPRARGRLAPCLRGTLYIGHIVGLLSVCSGGSHLRAAESLT
ncbi:hypothetical protein SCOCK_160194 [Actinacidiphila cocklensis]|uniref:Uncharacterized protein n=1 Tax=Actinacidiphila cocklensis TaxID=887465 RepID=A0A9W4GPM7_9ACTN|nr:hypothetical protein SCOCK_160194 [Actinacidiphila cocklensis]